MPVEGLAQLVSSIGIGGVLVWYLYHTTTKTIPDLTTKHTTNIENVTNKFSDTLRDERTARREEIEELKTCLRGCQYNTVPQMPQLPIVKK